MSSFHARGIRLTLLSVLVLAPALDQAAYAAPPSPLYGIAWEDTFTGTSVDTSRWNFRTDAKRLSVQETDNAVIVNNQLNLLMEAETNVVNGVTYNYTGGGVVSKQKFGYGYFEVQARTTSNRGWHNSFWMMAGDGSNTFAAGRWLEIDQSEIDSQNPRSIPSGLQIWDGQEGSGNNTPSRCTTYTVPNGGSTADGLHTYGADWREGAIDFYFDGVKYCTRSYPTNTYRQDPINIWLTALAYIAPVDTGGTAQIYDNVRFYKRDQYVMNGRYGYSESGADWADSTITGFGLMPQRYSCTAGDAAVFAPGFNQSGNYQVYIYKVVHPNADTQAEITVRTTSGTQTSTLNFRTGSSGWVDLGQYYFNQASSAAGQSVTNTVHSGCQRAGAVKFVRIP